MTPLEIRAESIYNLIKAGLENQFDSRLAKLEIENELQKTVRETLEIIKQGVDLMLYPAPKPMPEQPEPVRDYISLLKDLMLPGGYKIDVAERGLKLIREVDGKLLKIFPHAVVAHFKKVDLEGVLKLIFTDRELKTNYFLTELQSKLVLPEGYRIKVRGFIGEEFESLVLWDDKHVHGQFQVKTGLLVPFNPVEVTPQLVARVQKKIDKALKAEGKA